jgi:hypothetical protein
VWMRGKHEWGILDSKSRKCSSVATQPLDATLQFPFFTTPLNARLAFYVSWIKCVNVIRVFP